MNTTYKAIVLVISFSFAFSTSISAAPGDLDMTFSGDGKLIDGVLLAHSRDDANGVAIQVDGKIVVAGARWVSRRKVLT